MMGMMASAAGGSKSSAASSNVDTNNTAGAVTIGGLNMGQKDELAGALKWGLVALAVVAASRYWAPKRN